ncbi:MAG: ferritin family protein [Thermodesulfobacteriota bacterium]|nr:ferritin family protein [Thermodesulfobacteriota bacterium]
MAYDFNIDEILSMAEEIERNGAAFYRSAAKGAPDQATANTLEELAAMEDQHEKTFAHMRAELSVDEKETNIFDPDDESAQYLKALADLRVFHEKTVDLSDMMSVLNDALDAEKDSIAFYVGMRGLVPEKLGKGRIDGIIREEMGHIVILTDKLTNIKGGS